MPKLHWKYQLHYDIRGAQESHVYLHPQEDMIKIWSITFCSVESGRVWML